ncbi:MAG: acyltransferase [Promicromonosporaceae bacterium]|nr:acyltransferase [Promicromonosporaceae bacterium]
MRTQTLRTLAASAPTSRLRYLDAFRAVAILLVIIGHWLVMTVANVDGELLGFTALPRIDRLWPLTWVFQVMPLFFLVGGVSSGIAWTRSRARGSTAAAWLLARQRRLMTPALVVLGLAVLGALLARGLGAPEGLVIQAVDAVTLPMWFLVIYLALMLATPLLYLLFERFRHLVVVVMVMLVVLSDTLRILTGNIYFGYLNYGLVWVIPYQVGFAWQRGTLRLTLGRAWALLGGSLLVLVLLTYVGPYPISMINIDSSLLNNTSPPTVALLVLAFAQIAAAWLLSGPVQRWLERSRWWWRAVVAVNAVTLTLFLWHMVAALTAALILNAMGRLPWWFTGTGWGDPRWWQGRLPWFLAITPLLLLFVLAFGWVETRPVRRAAQSQPPGPAPPPTPRGEATGMLAVTAISYSLVVGGLLWMARAPSGFHGPAVIPTGALLLVALGSLIRFWVSRARDPSPLATSSPTNHG